MSTPLLEARKLKKSFGNVHALRGADFTIYPGEVVALVGDNGAGKSTLVETLSGNLKPDSGEILIDGKPVRFNGPTDSQASGIEILHQDLALAPHLDPGANLYLGREIRRKGLLGKLGMIDKEAMRVKARERFTKLGVRLQNDRAPIGTMSGGQKQGIAVVRSATWAQRLLFLDEPTAALGVVQREHVLELIKRVKDSGVAVVLISHNLPEVFEAADRIEVLRLGERVGRFESGDASMEQVVGSMTGALGMEGH